MGNMHSGIEDRTYYDVVYQGFLMFLSGWISIHPNIPSKQVAGKVPFWRKFFTLNQSASSSLSTFSSFRKPLSFGLFASSPPPEHWERNMKVHAFRKRENGWTTTHGFFLVMGGFKGYREEEPGEQIRVSDFVRLIRANQLAFPEISESEILDRSKQDGLAFAAFLLLAIEFWAREIVRATSLDLKISRFESLTASLAIIFFIIRFIWFLKPMDVQFSVPLQILPGASLTPRTILAPHHSPLLGSFFQMLGSAEDNDALENEFYSPNSKGLDGIVPAVLSGLCTALFIGIVHCFSWNAHCSWPFIKTLWRILSVTTTLLPFVFCVLCGIVDYIDNKREKQDLSEDLPKNSPSQKGPSALPAWTHTTNAVAFLHIAVRCLIFVLILVEVFQMRTHRSPDVFSFLTQMTMHPKGPSPDSIPVLLTEAMLSGLNREVARADSSSGIDAGSSNARSEIIVAASVISAVLVLSCFALLVLTRREDRKNKDIEDSLLVEITEPKFQSPYFYKQQALYRNDQEHHKRVSEVSSTNSMWTDADT
ncbi:hypothetical protein BJ165DRAFT_1548501 [Panaeolus papilionaceus]|nr:hypothetical protein BJ165DRAFT_1548501 [Panaeolus papilionaceus]